MIEKNYTRQNFGGKTRQMAKKLYKADFKDKLPLGGIGTGHIDLAKDGRISADFLSLFAVKAEKDGGLFDARMLEGMGGTGSPLPCFEKASAKSFFPFSEICFSDSSFPADVKMTAFSPFIPLSDTDSGIPAVMFDFTLTNKFDTRIEYSICASLRNEIEGGFNRMGCTDTGEAYIFLSENAEHPQNICIATSGKNISFCEYSSSLSDVIDNFTKEATLTNKTKFECENTLPFGALATHFSLEAGETKTVCFCISWYKPENEFSRNYYAQYFESALECASYFFRQKGRLFAGSMEFCENVLGATLTEGVLSEINDDLFSLINDGSLRLSDGTLKSVKKQQFCDMDSFLSVSSPIANLFPSLEYSEVLSFYKNGLYEKAPDSELALAILRSYRKYILSADVDALIEDWYYIVKCSERLFGENMDITPRIGSDIQAAVVEALSVMSEAVKDKKRHGMYPRVLENLPLCQFSMCIAKGYARLSELSGFTYSAVDRHIGFNPSSDSCPLDVGGTFRCFFCTPKGFGYVEEGIDYIEINLLSGKLDIRSFSVPRTPRLVQYGGRNWRFENRNLVVHLDSDLEVTPHKKLTIFIDIKQ